MELSVNPPLVSPPASAIHSHFQVQSTQADCSTRPRHPCPTSPVGRGRSGGPEVPPLEGAEGGGTASSGAGPGEPPGLHPYQAD